MKHMHCLLIISILVVLAAPQVQAQSLRVVVNDVTPQPVEPGNDLTLRVTYSNVNNDFAQRLSAQVDLRAPFTLKTATESFELGFDLCSFCSRTNTYFIHVDPAAASGTYPIFIRVMSGGNGTEYSRSINVTVTGRPNLIIFTDAITNATPAAAIPLDLRIANIGTGAASEVKVIAKSAEFIALGGSVVVIDHIAPGNTSAIMFSLSLNEDLKASSYNIPFEINYRDELGVAHNVSQNVGIRVVNDGLLNVESIKVAATSGTPVAGQPISIIIRLENIGHGNANGIEAEVTCSGRSAKAFLGQLKRDEDAPAVFDLTIPTGGKHDCLLTTRYADDTGTKTMTARFEATLREPELPILPIVVIVAIVAFLLYRRRKSKTHKAV